MFEIIDNHFEYTNIRRKKIENEYDSQFDDYRDINQEERTKFLNNKLSYLTIHKKLQQLNPKDILMDYDGNSLYTSAMWHDNSVYPKIETGFAFKPNVNDVYVEAFNSQSFNKHDDESAILRIK